MTTLRFSSLDAVLPVAALLPAGTLSTPVRWWREGAEVCVAPDAPLGKEAVARLERAGIAMPGAKVPSESRRGETWFELITPTRVAETDARQVLFLCQGSDTAVAVATELWRLGCDRQRLLDSDAGSMILADGPPYYTVCRAFERRSKLRAFVPMREGIFIEYGYRHPWLETLVPPAGASLLLSSDGRLRAFDPSPFADLHDLAAIVPPASAAVETRAFGAPIVVTPSLRPAPANLASLWVMERPARGELDRWVSDSPESLVAKLRFLPARLGDADIVLLQQMEGEAFCPPAMARAYAAHPRVRNLFLPEGTALEPPLRPDRLRELFASDDDALVWIANHGGAIRRHAVRAADFQPLARFVDYVIDQHADQIRPWIESTLFDLDGLEIEDVEDSPNPPTPSRAPAETSEADPVQPVQLGVPTRPRNPRSPSRRKPAKPKRATAAAPAAAQPSPDESATIQALRALEERATAQLLQQGKVPEEMLPDLARAYASAGLPLDACACLGRWLWAGNPVTELPALAMAEARDSASRTAGRAAEFLVAPAPLPTVVAFLESDGLSLDVRTRWLVQVAAAGRDGMDTLGLARAYDAVLLDLRQGLHPERDLPAFLRAHARAADEDSCSALAKALDLIAAKLRAIPQAPPTVFYLDHVVAYGRACLQRGDDARAVLEAPVIQPQDAIHRWLIRAYRARVERALAGERDAPLPEPERAALAALPKFDRYKVDRLRAVSYVLEPSGHVEPFYSFQSAKTTAAEALARIDDPARLDRDLHAVLAKAQTASDQTERGRLCLQAVQAFGRLHPSDVARLLGRAIEVAGCIDPHARAAVLAQAVEQAALFGHEHLVEPLLEPLRESLAELEPDHLPLLLMGCLSALLRVGHRESASALCDQLRIGLGEQAPLPARVLLAAANRLLGHEQEVDDLMARALSALRHPSTPKDRVQLAHALLRLGQHLPLPRARRLWDDLAHAGPVFVDTLSTNSHFSLSTLALAEALVHAVWSRAEAGRGHAFLQADETAVREHMHHDYLRLMGSRTP